MSDKPQLPAETDLYTMLRWTADGLIPAIVQDHGTGEVLMMAWMNQEALTTTLKTNQTHFYSRSRGRLWHKGGTSGHTQRVLEIRIDCDADVLLILVDQEGGACHEGYRSCFFRVVNPDGSLQIREHRVFAPEKVYGKS